MREIKTLHYRDVAPGRPFHAASVTFNRRGGDNVTLHDHDFYEALLVIEGRGLHSLNGVDRQLNPGELFLLRPQDCHAIAVDGRPRLHFMNIAFDAASWEAFSAPALPSEIAADWKERRQPVSTLVAGPDFDRAAATFRRLCAYSAPAGERIELVRFWTEIVSLLTESFSPAPRATDMPAWLDSVLAEAGSPENVREGVPALVARAGVSAAHLSRTLKAGIAMTPTEFVNQHRLRRAATLLASSSMDIVDIAMECGFDNLSYFYRLFGNTYHKTPRRYRIEERRRVAPGAFVVEIARP